MRQKYLTWSKHYTMKVSFIVNYIHINGGWSPWDQRVGGSEEAVIEWSKRLVALGHDVQVFHNGKHGLYCGVEYLDHSEYVPNDITINVNYPEFEPKGTTIYYTTLDRNPDLSKFDAVGVLSQYAKENTGVIHRDTHIIPLGYDETQIYPDKKVSKQCFYASSPDRGLETLLEAWPEVHRAHPDATLILTYGADVAMDGVINLGSVDNETMNEVFRTSQVWCHPANGGELYCITGVKAQAAGCWPVIIPAMALAETVKYGTFTTKEQYAEALSAVLDDVPEPEKHSYPTWDDSTALLLSLIEKCYNGGNNMSTNMSQIRSNSYVGRHNSNT